MPANTPVTEPVEVVAEPTARDLLIVQILNQRDTAERWVKSYEYEATKALENLKRNRVKVDELTAILTLLDPDFAN